MNKTVHEIRDPIHGFVRLDSDERAVLDSRPLQRLRDIHQLAVTYLVYPAATHKRFEHSLGVMELASRVFDVITQPEKLSDKIKKSLPETRDRAKLDYWRRVLRMAALCHDIGHLPFSHAAEHELLPTGWNHERMTVEMILSDEMKPVWKQMKPKPDPEDVSKIAVGPRKALGGTPFTPWEALLSEIIVGDALGADRMDYLLRDSYHIGAAYGRFDHYRLIDTLRILLDPGTQQPALGVEEGGIQSAEALLLARYLMYSQVYFHHVRRIYDIHLQDFLKKWLPNGYFSTAVDKHLSLSDSQIISAIHERASDESKPGHEPAKRLLTRDHFRLVYNRNPQDIRVNPEAAQLVYEALQKKFGKDSVRLDRYKEKGGAISFPVLTRDGRVVSAIELSQVLQHIPVLAVDYVFVERSKFEDARKWLETNRKNIIQPPKEDV